jgi:glucose/arabinose dehydrogenase
MTSVRDGGFYGWPYSYYGRNVDKRVKDADRRPDLVERAIVPDYALGAHTASLGLTFYKARASRPTIAAASSSASTARGTATRRPATR